jgi:ribosomal protein L11 methyltransferase
MLCQTLVRNKINFLISPHCGAFFMSEYFIELDLTVEPAFAEILMAELSELGFDSFVDSEKGILAYIEEPHFEDQAVKMLIENYSSKTSLFYTFKRIKKENWNKEWESNFSPIYVEDKIEVRADFHNSKGLQYEIIIVPKMSFGTGHHETTHQVMALQLEIDHNDKTVLDVGTGTGILAILAAKLGATKIHGFDIDAWSVENTLENITLNHTDFISVSQGTIAEQIVEPYDIVLANINRNILLAEIASYRKFMKKDSVLIVSGFYEKDAEDIVTEAAKHGLVKIKQSHKNQWAAIVFRAD